MNEPRSRSSGTALASPRDQQKLERALVLHTYALMTSEGVGGALVGAVMTMAIILVDTGWRYAIWATLQVTSAVINVGVHGLYREHAERYSAEQLRFARRAGIVVTGITWGVGGLLFPIGGGVDLGFAILLCYAGLCAGAASTMAGDPVAYVLFAATALLPTIVSAFPELWWVSGLVFAYALLTTDAVFRHHRALIESMLLRFENIGLLQEAIAEREAAVAARRDAERAAEAKTRFLAAASHDLRQPVQALALFVDLLQRDPKLDLAERVRAIAALARTTDAMRAMIEALLDISRLDAGLVQTTPRALPLEPLLAEIVTALRDEAESHDMVIHSAGRIATVFADPNFLSRVLHNLATNAVRHARRGRVLIAVRPRETHVTVQVWDQGPGIAEGDRERIFEEYVQLENRERDRRKGLGLGLPMVRRMCELSGWTLHMRTTPGRGTMFSVDLPRAAQELPREAPSRRAPLSRPLTVLLVEDDSLVREALVACLEASGCVVHVAHNVEEARAELARLASIDVAPDLVVTDHRLPGAENGGDLVRYLQDEKLDLPVVLMTGDDLDMAYSDVSSDHVTALRKPVSAEALWKAIHGVMRADASTADEPPSIERAG